MWLLKHDVAQAMQRALKLGFNPSAEQRTEFLARRYGADSGGMPGNLLIAGDTAEISVSGVLTQQPDFFCWLFGGGNTTYSDIQSALALADKDPNVKKAVLKVDSPGGTVAGLFDTIAALQAFSKPMTVKSAMACSAAYALAASAGKIEAVGASSEFGSIGVVCSYSFDADEEQIDVTSSEAPDKRPDPRTPEGKAKIVEYLDAIHELFAGSIAQGRSTAAKAITVEDVNASFGRGAVLLAGEAKKRGMIDKVPAPPVPAKGKRASAEADDEQAPVPDPIPAPVAQATAPSNKSPLGVAGQKASHMTKAELIAAHPELVAEIRKEALAEERDRVEAHLTSGEASGDMKTALAAVREGTLMTQALMAKYMMAGMNRRDVAAAQTDSDAAAAVVAGAALPAAEGGKDLGDKVADIIEARMGKKPKA